MLFKKDCCPMHSVEVKTKFCHSNFKWATVFHNFISNMYLKSISPEIGVAVKFLNFHTV